MLRLCFVHRQLGAREPQQPSGKPHVVGMHVRKEDAPDIRPGDAARRHGGLQRFKGGIGLHAAIDQQVAVFERYQVDVDRFEFERQAAASSIRTRG